MKQLETVRNHILIEATRRADSVLAMHLGEASEYLNKQTTPGYAVAKDKLNTARSVYRTALIEDLFGQLTEAMLKTVPIDGGDQVTIFQPPTLQADPTAPIRAPKKR